MNNRIDAIYARQSVDKKDSIYFSCNKLFLPSTSILHHDRAYNWYFDYF